MMDCVIRTPGTLENKRPLRRPWFESLAVCVVMLCVKSSYCQWVNTVSLRLWHCFINQTLFLKSVCLRVFLQYSIRNGKFHFTDMITIVFYWIKNSTSVLTKTNLLNNVLRAHSWPQWMPQNLSNEESKLVQVMVWCRQTTSHYLSNVEPDVLCHTVSLRYNAAWWRHMATKNSVDIDSGNNFCLAAPCHYLSQCWTRSIMPHGVITLQCGLVSRYGDIELGRHWLR